MTNGDKIRQMSDDELATLISRTYHNADYEDDDWDPAFLAWLKQEVPHD